MRDQTLLETVHGPLRLPTFLPDATLGVVRSVDSADLEQVGVQALVMNVFHLMQKPGSFTIQALGGLHQMAGWSRPTMTDSGGFQAYSLIRQNPKAGSITDRGIAFLPEGANRQFLLTPEKCIQLQMAYGADIIVCLDDCTHVDAPRAEQEASVARTIRWAKRCKEEFQRQSAQRRLPTPKSKIQNRRVRFSLRWCRVAAIPTCAAGARRCCWRSGLTATAAGPSIAKEICFARWCR